MNAFIKNSTFCKSSHNLIYVNLYINQVHTITLLVNKKAVLHRLRKTALSLIYSSLICAFCVL